MIYCKEYLSDKSRKYIQYLNKKRAILFNIHLLWAISWWCDDTLSALLVVALLEVNLLVTGGQEPVMWSDDVFFIISLNIMLKKQLHCRLFEMPWCSRADKRIVGISPKSAWKFNPVRLAEVLGDLTALIWCHCNVEKIKYLLYRDIIMYTRCWKLWFSFVISPQQAWCVQRPCQHESSQGSAGTGCS